jgi:acyl dehydratase
VRRGRARHLVIHFEDMVPGERLTVPAEVVDRDEMVRFAEEWDPMPFHVDGGSAPGVYMLAFKQRLIHRLPKMAVQASFGYDEVRFHQPVRPGDTLSLTVEWVSRRESTSKPNAGIVTIRFSLVNQHDAAVLSHLDTVLVTRRR